MYNRWQQEFDSFKTYLDEHPTLRFWQALLAWTVEVYKGQEDIGYILVSKMQSRGHFPAEDTYYWDWQQEEGPDKNND